MVWVAFEAARSIADSVVHLAVSFQTTDSPLPWIIVLTFFDIHNKNDE